MEELRAVFQEEDLYLDENDPRIDAEDDISSEDETIINDYWYKKSNASCKIKEIKSITYGGFSSRFWLYRKHMISQDPRILRNKDLTPFYAWECLTLELGNRDIDIIIRKEA